MEIKVEKEVEQAIGIMLAMGIVEMPDVRCYWAHGTRYPSVADVMSKNRFLQLLQNLHFVDNENQNIDKKDKAWKIRPFLSRLRHNFLKYPPEEYNSIDEMMIKFKERSSLKQYMPKKPSKWGFKLWARAGGSRFLHHFEIYQPDSEDMRHGLAGNVVLRLAQSLPEIENYKIFADNYFTSEKLVETLTEKGYLYVGTVQERRLEEKTLASDAELKKLGRGSWSTKKE